MTRTRPELASKPVDLDAADHESTPSPIFAPGSGDVRFLLCQLCGATDGLCGHDQGGGEGG